MTVLEHDVGGERTVLGTCHHDCPDSCGWIATARDGVLVELRGNPAHPYSQGELCPKVNRFVHRVNDADRLLHPMIRTGPKGAGEFRTASWAEALELVRAKVTAAVADHGGETVYPWSSAGTQGAIQQNALHPQFFANLGASRQTGSVCGVVAATGMASVYGAGLGADPLSVVDSDLIILWGTNTRLTNRHLWPFIQQARARGARVIAVDPVRTMTAASCDEHLALRPGTDVPLLQAIAHVLIRDGHLDQAYLDAHAEGFSEFSASVAHTTPDWAATRCGLDVEVIERLATAYGSTERALLRALVGAEHQPQGGATFALLSALPVITGKWQHRGGGFARSVGAWAEVADVDLEQFGVSRPDARGLDQPRLGRWLTELDPPITVLFAWNGNPLVSMPNSAAVRRGLERDDLFTVVHEQFMTDTARYADVVFPAAMETEQYDVMPSWGHLWLGWNEPAAEPLGEAVSNTEFFRRLADAFEMSDEIFGRTDLELIDLVLSPDVDQELLRRDGFVRLQGTDEHRPWVDGGFPTATGKARLPVVEWQGSPTDARHPIQLLTAKQQVRFLNSSYSGLQGHREKESDPVVELHEADAQARAIRDGDQVRVTSEQGSIELPAKIGERVRPGVAVMPWGFWTENDQLANDVTSDAATDSGGGAAYCTTNVEIERISRPS